MKSAEQSYFLVGIKGSGMASLACHLKRRGAFVTGSDSPQQFFTDSVLQQAGINWVESENPVHLSSHIDTLIYSASYQADVHPQILEARKRKLPIFSYPHYMAKLSRQQPTWAVAGTHGKTTSVGALQYLLSTTDLHCACIYGSSLQQEIQQDYSSPIDCLLVEACEYRDHFLLYHLNGLLITTIEFDHPDWFATENEVLLSFIQLVSQLPSGALVVLGLDSPLTRKLSSWIELHRSDIHLTTYGEHQHSMVQVISDETSFGVKSLGKTYPYTLGSLPLALDVVGSALLASYMYPERSFASFMEQGARFTGCKGRVEQLLVEHGVFYYDDYAHHPTEIRASLAAVRTFHPKAKVVVVFYPHTLSRSVALFSQFVLALQQADELFIRPIYSSQRSDGTYEANKTEAAHLAQKSNGRYIESEAELIDVSASVLHSGDVCITMGAGNNYGLALRIAAKRGSLLCSV
ncbi:MAG: glutamate ligase domain-containing protein [Sphaerochaetaceae bacterium]